MKKLLLYNLIIVFLIFGGCKKDGLEDREVIIKKIYEPMATKSLVESFDRQRKNNFSLLSQNTWFFKRLEKCVELLEKELGLPELPYEPRLPDAFKMPGLRPKYRTDFPFFEHYEPIPFKPIDTNEPCEIRRLQAQINLGTISINMATVWNEDKIKHLEKRLQRINNRIEKEPK